MKCAIDTEVETNLRCGKCGQPICPKCMVQTPVGARCPNCAKQYKLPTYRVSTSYYLRAAGAALGMAIVCGFIWGLLNSFIPFFNLNLILSPASGYVISEVISRATNRKSGRGLAIIAGTAVILSYLVNVFTFGAFPFGSFRIIIDLIAIVLGVYVASNRMR